MSNVVSIIDPDILCKKLLDWISTAKRGEQYCYFIGPHVSGNKVARIAFQMYEKGRVTLVQKRESNHFSYWVQKT